jgi:hypothetical protein
MVRIGCTSFSWTTAAERHNRRPVAAHGFMPEERSLYLYDLCDGMTKHGKCSKKM